MKPQIIELVPAKVEVMTDGMSDDSLLHFWNTCCPRAEMYRMYNSSSFLLVGKDADKALAKAEEQWAKRRVGLTEAQHLRLKELTNGQYREYP